MPACGTPDCLIWCRVGEGAGLAPCSLFITARPHRTARPPILDCRPSVSSVNDSDYLRRESRPCSDGLDLDADQAHVSHPGPSGVPIWRVSLD